MPVGKAGRVGVDAMAGIGVGGARLGDASVGGMRGNEGKGRKSKGAKKCSVMTGALKEGDVEGEYEGE